MKYEILAAAAILVALAGCAQNEMERGSLELKIPRENPGAGEEVQVIANATGYGDGKII